MSKVNVVVIATNVEGVYFNLLVGRNPAYERYLLTGCPGSQEACSLSCFEEPKSPG